MTSAIADVNTNVMAEFKNVDIKNITVFGKSMPKDKCWANMLSKAKDFSLIDKKKFEDSLKWNVESSYYRLASITFKDLDTELEWFLSFITDQKKWDLELGIDNEKADATVSPDQKFDALNNPDIKRVIEKMNSVMLNAAAACKEKVMQHVEAGELLDVDETKLERVLDAIDDNVLMANLKKRAFVR